MRQLARWVREAPDSKSYQRRLAIWMTAEGPHHAHVVAATLQCSVRTVWRWLGLYNLLGPDGLESGPWGGRHHAYLSFARERAVLRRLERQAAEGRLLTVQQVRAAVEAAVGHEVSLSYIYHLMQRHGWRKLQPRPLHAEADPEVIEAFKKTSRRCFGA